MDDEAAGVPEWIVTNGDMMSLQLTVFTMVASLREAVTAAHSRDRWLAGAGSQGN